jgi:carbonic anhydrase/acetyltransferase-like protein (isoleucine patch superfamily)
MTVYVATTALIYGDVSAGPGASFWDYVVVRGDTAPVFIGAATNLQEGVVVHVAPGASCTVGEGVTVGHRAVLHGCYVGDAALIGIGAIILNGARIGHGVIVAAGTVVTEDTVVPADSLVVGVPGRVVGRVSDELASRSRRISDVYQSRAREFLPSRQVLRPRASRCRCSGRPGLANAGDGS